MSVTKISDSNDRDIHSALQDLMMRHEGGQIRGLIFAVKLGPRAHRIGFAGAYWDDPHDALGIVTRMEYKVNQWISARDGDPDTRTMPL